MTSEKVINDRYRLIKILGEGGMGTVWLADDLQLRRRVALKQLLPLLGTADLPERRLRAMTEARAMAMMNHPAIVRIFDVFLEAGNPWLVMEYIEGRQFHDLIKEGRLDDRGIARIALPVLRGLQAAHANGLIHRDVKPRNILVAGKDEADHRDAMVFLVDFGIAKIDGDVSLTSYGGGTPGTVDYVAPERFEGKEARAPSDLWSFGVTLFYALEGYSPFLRGGPAAREATRWAILNDPTPRLKSQGRLAEITVLLLQKDPSRRPTAVTVAEVLQAVLDEPTVDLPVGREPTTKRIAPSSNAPEAPPPPVVKVRPPAVEPPLNATQLHNVREMLRRASPENGMNMLLTVSDENAAQILAGLRSREAGALIQAIAGTRPRTAGTMLQILASSGAGHAIDYVSAPVSASILMALPTRDAARVLARSRPRTGAQILMELPQETSVSLVAGMPAKSAVAMLEYVWPNTVAELFLRSKELRAELLGQLDPEFRAHVLRFL